MDLLVLLVAVVTVGGAAAVAAGRVRGGLDPATSTRPHHPLPDGALRRGDVDALQFSLGLRGYRMDEVDEALARLADELADRDAQIAELQAARPHPELIAQPAAADAPAAPTAAAPTADVTAPADEQAGPVGERS